MTKVALVTDKENRRGVGGDRLLIGAFKKVGIKAEFKAWEDRRVKWREYDGVIIRSCWNYHQKYKEWLEWLDGLMAINAKVWNPVEILKWNSNKSYLLELKAKGVKAVPTLWLKAGEPWPELKTLTTEQWVLKPLIGAAGAGVELLSPVGWGKPLNEDRLLQPLMREIYQGHYSLVFLNRKFSHGVIRIPKPGEYRTNYAFGSVQKRVVMDKTIIDQAREILERVDGRLLYARVDGIIRENQLVLMELELCEPYLSLELDDEAADRLVESYLDLCRI